MISMSIISCNSDTSKNEWTAYPPLSGMEIDQTGYDDLLVHIVLFPVKENVSSEEKDEMIKQIVKLENIPQVKGLSVGNFTDLEDKRALDQYAITMTMGFSSKADYIIYQDHPIHLQLKKDIGKYLSGPPVTYDFNAINL